MIQYCLISMGEHARPATVAQRFRSLQQFMKWLVAEEELDVNPMARMVASTVPDAP